MKKSFVAFGVAVAIICGALVCSISANNFGEDPLRDREAVEVNLGDAIEAYLDNEGIDDYDYITITDRYYDKNYDCEVADVMLTGTDGSCGFAKVQVESVANWYVQNN